MAASPARMVAFDVLLRVQTQNAYAMELVHAKGSQFAELSPADRGLCMQLTMGVLRWQSKLDRAIRSALSDEKQWARLDPEVLTALRLGVLQLQYLERIPASAAVHESVELVKRARKRSAVPFANAVLRKLSKLPPSSQPESLAEQFAHPEWLVENWTRQFGAVTTKLICSHDQSLPTTTIRLNRRFPQAEQELIAEGIELAPGGLLREARRVVSGDVSRTNTFRAGHVAIQDEASQLVAALVGNAGSILDCCAAPGGKTSAIAERNPEAKILAVELHPHRARLMKGLLRAKNIDVIVGDAAHLPIATQFERILADVPCSGTGTLARNPEIKWRIKASDIDHLHERQVAILSSALDHLAPGGRLIYSTCSLEEKENSGVVNRVLGPRAGFRLVPCVEILLELKKQGELLVAEVDSLISGSFLRTIPGVHRCDGFFAAVIEKESRL